MALTACASHPVPAPAAAPETLESVLAEADRAQTAGQHDQAVKLLDHAATLDPTSKEPWLRQAQMEFDAANYPQACNAALEVIQRDPADATANSILTVSGLRMSTQAVARLRPQGALSGSARSEATTLARTIRENLGEDVLVPAAGSPPSASAKRPAPSGKPAASTQTASRRPAPSSGTQLQIPDAVQSAMPSSSPSLPSTPSMPSTPSLPSSTPQLPDTSDPFSVLKR